MQMVIYSLKIKVWFFFFQVYYVKYQGRYFQQLTKVLITLSAKSSLCLPPVSLFPPDTWHNRDYLLLSHLIVHYSTFILLTVFGHPENEVSIGYHEQVGPCNETVLFPSAVGIVSIWLSALLLGPPMAIRKSPHMVSQIKQSIIIL